MATSLMRLIDYWLGIPLCLLLDGINRVIRMMPFRQKEKIPVKALFIKLSEMGAIILSYSLIKEVKKEYPESEVFFLTFSKNRPLVEALNIIKPQNILAITEDSLWGFIRDACRVIWRMRKEKVGMVFDLELFSRFTAILTYLSGAAKRIGFYRYHFEGLYRGNLLTHNVQYNPLIHTSKLLLSLAQVMKLPAKSTPELEKRIEDADILTPEFIPPEEELQHIRQRLGSLGVSEGARLFLTNPGDGVIPSREWPLDNFAALSKMLLEDDNNYVIIIGTGGVMKKAQALCQLTGNKRCLDLTNQTSLSEVLSLFHIAEALIVNDCGLAHIASLAPVKKFVIFGPESPQLYAPLGENVWILYSKFPCSPCLSTFNQRESACRDSRCLQAISPDETYQLIKEHLKWEKR